MRRNLHKHDDDCVYLDKGYVYFGRKPMKIHAVLGAAVAVCLWDRRLRHGGMNHFTRPAASEREKATPIYGNAAMAALLRIMEQAGSAARDIVAQIFGGGLPEKSDNGIKDIGTQNVNIARKTLRRRGIRIVSEDVGGSLGRKIIFDLGSGNVAVLKVEKIRLSDWHIE